MAAVQSEATVELQDGGCLPLVQLEKPDVSV
jgi:hypothetical protein